MANEFKIKKGLIVTGADGGTVVDIQGSQGQLFSVTDDLSGSIFAVSDISGVPILDVNSSGTVTIDGSLTGDNATFSKKLLLNSPDYNQHLSMRRGIYGYDTIITGTRVDFSPTADTLSFKFLANLQTTGDVTVSGGDLTINSTGNAVLNVNGTDHSFIEKDTGNDLYFANNVSDKDIKFRVKDDGTNVIALTIDGSEGGNSTFAAKAFSAATSSGDASSTLTTKSYVDGLITGATIYRGAWQAGISATSSAATTTSTTLTVTAAILDADGNTPVLVGAVVTGEGITGIVKVASVTSSTVYVLDTAITATATAYIFSPIYGAPSLDGVTQTSGYYYICSEAGSATPNGANSEPNTWNVGDWCIYNDVSGTGQWQKIDNSSVLSGAGTGQTVALWEGPSSVTDSDTLGNAPITVIGNDTAFAGNVTAYTGGGTGSLSVGRTADQSIKLYVTDANNKITAAQDSDGDAAHKFILNRVFAGTGANDFIIQKDGTAQFTLDTSANATFAGTVNADLGILATGAMSSFETTLSNNDDWANSPISILERSNVQGTQTADKYAPNLNFHWGGKFSASLWMSANGHLHYGQYGSTGIPSSDGTINAATFLGDLNGTINTATTGVTQTAGNNSTLIATTAYADAAAAAVPIGNYLPLTGGTVTGDLTTNGVFTIQNAAPYIQWKDAAGTRLGYIQHNATDLVMSADTGEIQLDTSANNDILINPGGTGKVGIGTTSPSYKLEVQGPTDSEGFVNDEGGNKNRLLFPKGGSYNGGNPITGAIKVTLPTSWTNTMLTITVRVFDYYTGESFDLTVAGYTYTGGPNWVNTSAWLSSQSNIDRNFTVRFGHDGTKCCFYIGELTSTWSYLKVNVIDATLNHSSTVTDWSTTAWAVGVESTAFLNVTRTHTNTQTNNWARNGQDVYYASGTGNVGIGTTVPADKLSIAGSLSTLHTGYTTKALRVTMNSNDTFLSLYARADQSSQQVLLRTNGNSYLNGGNVGIGTSSPGTKLEVTDTIQTTKQTRSKGWYTSGSGLALETGVSGGKGYVLSYNRTTSSYADTIIESTGVKFVTASSGKFYFTGGNVGIGTTSPRDTLEIVGNMRFVNGEDHLMIKPNNAIQGADFIVGDGISATDTPVMSLNGLYGGQVTIQTQGSSVADKTVLDVQGTQGQLFSVTDDLSGDIFSVADISGVPIMNVNSDGTSYFDGNVGIGTDSPDSKLDVKGTSATPADGNQTLSITNSTGGTQLNLGTAENSYGWIEAREGSTLRNLLINPNGGNVGIGVTNPGVKLDVAGTVRSYSSAGNYGQIANGSFQAVGAHGGTFMLDLDNTSTADLVNIKKSGSSRFYIQNGGNVGIGTTSPGSKLEVNGSIDAGGDGYLINGKAWAFEISDVLTLGDWDGQEFSTRIMDNNSSEVLRVTDGRVGIGTTSPSTELDVDGTGTFGTGSAYSLILKSSSGSRGIKILSSDGTYRGGIDWNTVDFLIRDASDAKLLSLNYSTKNATLLGNVTAVNFILSSDERKKTKIKDLACNNIDVNWRSFELKQNEGEYRTGVIAQELEEKHPEFVNTDDEGFKSVKYIDLLIAKIAELEARLEKLEK